MQHELLISRLRAQIGLSVRCSGRACKIIEVLEQGPSLILQCDNGDAVIQGDQFGSATRRVPRTLTVPVLTADGADYHADFQALEIGLDA